MYGEEWPQQAFSQAEVWGKPKVRLMICLSKKLFPLQCSIQIYRPGLNFINVLRTAFTLVYPESVKRYQWLNCIFYAFGIYERKSCDTRCQFHQHLWAAFAPVDPKSIKRHWQLDWILTLWGAAGVKAVHIYVGEIEPCLPTKQRIFSSLLRYTLKSCNNLTLKILGICGLQK